tara:strand:- start:94 stop:669 length:576 start_codon:yes stop_codon:yes gene_type:complete
MKLIKCENSINHDYYNVVIAVYPKIIESINGILKSFKENRDASQYFVDYFEKGHREIHSVLASNISCSKINDLLSDLFLSLTKFERKSFCYEIPEIFYNYHAVHYYHQIKKIISNLDNNNVPSEKIIDYLVKYEIKRHENNECFCGENHEILDSFKLRELLTKILDYYYSVQSPLFSQNSMIHQSEHIYWN